MLVPKERRSRRDNAANVMPLEITRAGVLHASLRNQLVIDAAVIHSHSAFHDWS